MSSLKSILFVVLAALFFNMIFALPHSSPVQRYHARRVSPAKRNAFSGMGTWFHVGLGACGQTNKDQDWIVALPTAQYENGKHCGKSITIQNGDGTTATAWVGDECPTCAGVGIDMSPGLFQYFTNLGVGTFGLTWWFNDSD